MILNGVMAVTLRYFTEFGKPAFQLITTSSSIELIAYEKSTSITHRAVKLVCVTKFSRIRMRTLPVNRLMLLLRSLWSRSSRIRGQLLHDIDNVTYNWATLLTPPTIHSTLTLPLIWRWSAASVQRFTSNDVTSLGVTTHVAVDSHGNIVADFN